MNRKAAALMVSRAERPIGSAQPPWLKERHPSSSSVLASSRPSSRSTVGWSRTISSVVSGLDLEENADFSPEQEVTESRQDY